MSDVCYVTRCYFYWRAPDSCILDVGDMVRVVGGPSSLGAWDHMKGAELVSSKRSPRSWYSVDPVYLQLGDLVEYKYAIVRSDGSLKQWDTYSGNRALTPTGIQLTVEDDDGWLRLSQLDLVDDDTKHAHQTTSKAAHHHAAIEAQIKLLQKQDASTVLLSDDIVLYIGVHLPVQIINENGSLRLIDNYHASMYPLFLSRKKTNTRMKFLGLAGFVPADTAQEADAAALLATVDCYAIPDAGSFHEHAEFCSAYLWPVMNNQMPLIGLEIRTWNEALWKGYRRANQAIAEAALAVGRKLYEHANRVIYWFNDYHLMLCPEFLRLKDRKSPLGIFIHTTFPSSDIFMTLPVRSDFVTALLCADLVGFQFYDYARHFQTCCQKILALQPIYRLGGFISFDVETADGVSRSSTLRVAHNSVQRDVILSAVRSPEAISRAEELLRTHSGKIIIGAVDRLGRLSGLNIKLRAFRSFLQTYPQHLGRVVLIQLAVTRHAGASAEAAATAREITELANSINAEFGHHVDFLVGDYLTEQTERVALLAVSDVLVDTSLRDGLNLIPLEYLIARAAWLSQHVNDPIVQLEEWLEGCRLSGRLICSEASGVCQVLAGAKRVNPWNLAQVVSALDEVISLPLTDATAKFNRDLSYAESYGQLQWAEEFTIDLITAANSRTQPAPERSLSGFGSRLEISSVVSAYSTADLRIFFLDNEGTLAPDLSLGRTGNREILVSHGNPPSPAVLNSLHALLQNLKNIIVILSGRDQPLLESWFAPLIGSIGLAAEHGYFWRLPQLSNEWSCVAKAGAAPQRWRELAQEIMNMYVRRTPGSFIENKGSALVWQFRDAERAFGTAQAKTLHVVLEDQLAGCNVDVTTGKGYVEVRVRGVSKGVAVATILNAIKSKFDKFPDFCFCAGDDRSDESMFETLKNYSPNYFSVTVGRKPSAANFFASDATQLSGILEILSRKESF